jgi:carboxylesterase
MGRRICPQEFTFIDILSANAVSTVVTGPLWGIEVRINRHVPYVNKHSRGRGGINPAARFEGGTGWWWSRPVSTRQLISHSNPAVTYGQASALIEALHAKDDDSINPDCRTQFLGHGQKMAKTMVLLHGLSNCPAQMQPLGQAIYDRGYNVLIPRFPHHGHLDRMTTDLANLTAEEIIQLGDEAADIAQGLGDEVTIAGFSMGGILAAWLAQQRHNIDQVVLVAPALGVATVPALLTDLAASTLLKLPNIFIWWDPRLKEKQLPEHAYPRFSTAALGQLLRLGASVREQSAQCPPASPRILVIINDNDLAVNRQVITTQVEQWRCHGASVETYTFPAELGLEHDLIDPDNPLQQVERVYPILLDLMAPTEKQVWVFRVKSGLVPLVRKFFL